MKNWTTSAIASLTLMALPHLAGAQSAGSAMGKPAGTDKTYTGCVAAGNAAGAFTLTHATSDSAMHKGGMGGEMMKKDAMGKDAMGKDAMKKDTMAPASLSLSSTAVDLSKHVGHKVSVTGVGAAMAKPDAMAKPGAMDTPMSALTVTSLKMIAATCDMK